MKNKLLIWFAVFGFVAGSIAYSQIGSGGASVGGGSPSSVQMGTGTGRAEIGGKVHVNTTSVGTDADTVEKDLLTYTLPANSLNADGKGVRITTWITTAATANEKTIRLYFGSTVVRQIGTSVLNNQSMFAQGIIIRTGASTQDAVGIEVGNTTAFAIFTAPAEDTTGTIVIKVTGQNSSAAANDIVAQGLMVEYIG